MEIRTIWQTQSQYPQFNLELASAPGAEAFIVVKGCKIANGSKGPFVSGPSTKGKDDRYWNHIYMNDRFSAAVLEMALSTQPQQAPQRAPDPAFRKPSQDAFKARQVAPARGSDHDQFDDDQTIPF